MLKRIALLSKKRPICTNDQESDSEPENISVLRERQHLLKQQLQLRLALELPQWIVVTAWL